MSVKPWPKEDLESVAGCPVCGGSARSLQHANLSDSVSGVAPGNWGLYRCAGCASGYLDPRPTRSSIGRAYIGYYTHEVEDQPIVRRKGRFRRVLHDLINGYMNHRYAVKRSPALAAGRWLIPWMAPLRSAADCECRHLPHLPDRGGHLLDVGCGNGGFLILAQEAGWQVKGVDFDTDAVSAAKSRDLDVQLGGIDLLNDQREAFDVITLSHVIEHVHEPNALLQAAYRLLKEGGQLWLETPNIESLGHIRFGRFWRGLESPRHLVLFSRTGIVNALADAGFRDIRFQKHGVIAATICVASTRIKDAESGSRSMKLMTVLQGILLEGREILQGKKSEYLTLVASK